MSDFIKNQISMGQRVGYTDLFDVIIEREDGGLPRRKVISRRVGEVDYLFEVPTKEDQELDEYLRSLGESK